MQGELTALPGNVKIYLPSTVEGQAPASASMIDRAKSDALTMFARLFGGATCYDAQGAWVSDEHGVITENIVIVEAFATLDAIAQSMGQVLELAQQIKRTFAQESVAIERDHVLISGMIMSTDKEKRSWH